MFFGSTLGNGNNIQETIQLNTTGYVDTGSGFSTIKPIKNGTLTNRPVHAVEGVPLRRLLHVGQVECDLSKDCADTATVRMVVNKDSSLTFDFAVNVDKQDFSVIGIDEPIDLKTGLDEENKATLITSVDFSILTAGYSFAEVKQQEWSPCAATGSSCVGAGTHGAVPEPSTWAMLLLGFCGIATMTWKNRRALA